MAIPVGKKSFEENQLVENTEAAIEAVNSAKPASSKGTYLVSGGVAASMSAGVKVALSPYQKI